LRDLEKERYLQKVPLTVLSAFVGMYFQMPISPCAAMHFIMTL